MKAKWWLGIAIAVVVATPVASLAATRARTIEIAVTEKGFEPARIKVAKGEPLKLVITRNTDATCAKEIVIAGENVKADLPLNKPVTISFTPKRTGEIRYACGMDMISGVLEVASNEPAGSPGTAGMQSMGDGGGTQRNEGATHKMSCGCMRRGEASNGS